MQTFLPYADFDETARVLDSRRLGKQRAECKQIYLGQFEHHPATRMWQPFKVCLLDYAISICLEWQARGNDDNLCDYFMCERLDYGDAIVPPWIGTKWLHSNHRARLLEKEPSWYTQFNWKERPTEHTRWPVI